MIFFCRTQVNRPHVLEKLFSRVIINHGFGVDNCIIEETPLEFDSNINSYFTFAFLGNIREYKDLQSLLYSYSKVKAEIPNVRLILIGPEYKRYFDEHPKELKLINETDVLLINQFVNNIKIIANAVDAFICTYKVDLEQFKYGFFPSSLANIGKYTKPIICPECKSVIDIIGTKKNAYLYDYEQSDSLYSTMATVAMSDFSSRNDVGNHLELHLQQYKWNKVVSSILNNINL